LDRVICGDGELVVHLGGGGAAVYNLPVHLIVYLLVAKPESNTRRLSRRTSQVSDLHEQVIQGISMLTCAVEEVQA